MRAISVVAVALCLLHGHAYAQDANDVLGALNELQSAVNGLPAELSSPAFRTRLGLAHRAAKGGVVRSPWHLR
jgi:hypothetical protein